ncbi:MAG: hydrolase [Chloroflexi bacterium]|nr:hydrolase [Chloroflexota bacterium]
MDDLRKDLTPEEKARPYSKYFYRKIVPPAPERLAAMDKSMDPGQALPIERLNDLLNPGYHEIESGWCVLPNGADGQLVDGLAWAGTDALQNLVSARTFRGHNK